MTGAPKNLGVDTFPEPADHFGAPGFLGILRDLKGFLKISRDFKDFRDFKRFKVLQRDLNGYNGFSRVLTLLLTAYVAPIISQGGHIPTTFEVLWGPNFGACLKC